MDDSAVRERRVLLPPLSVDMPILDYTQAVGVWIAIDAISAARKARAACCIMDASGVQRRTRGAAQARSADAR